MPLNQGNQILEDMDLSVIENFVEHDTILNDDLKPSFVDFTQFIAQEEMPGQTGIQYGVSQL